MRVFAATRRGQGDRDDDFFHGIEGELVWMPMDPCANPRCGCDRSVAGFASSRASTTFMSVERPELDADTYRELFVDALERQGWLSIAGGDGALDAYIDWHIDAAAQCPADRVLRATVERTGGGYTIRAGRG